MLEIETGALLSKRYNVRRERWIEVDGGFDILKQCAKKLEEGNRLVHD